MRNRESSILILCHRMVKCGLRPKKWWQRKAIDSSTGKVNFRKTPCYQIAYERGDVKTVDFNGIDSVVVEHPWKDIYEMVDPMSDMNCLMKLGGTKVTLSELFPAGQGPHARAVKTSNHKKDESIWNKLWAELQEMAQSTHPSVPKLDPNFLKESENKALQKTKQQSRERLEKSKNSGSFAKKRRIARAKSAASD